MMYTEIAILMVPTPKRGTVPKINWLSVSTCLQCHVCFKLCETEKEINRRKEKKHPTLRFSTSKDDYKQVLAQTLTRSKNTGRNYFRIIESNEHQSSQTYKEFKSYQNNPQHTNQTVVADWMKSSFISLAQCTNRLHHINYSISDASSLITYRELDTDGIRNFRRPITDCLEIIFRRE